MDDEQTRSRREVLDVSRRYAWYSGLCVSCQLAGELCRRTHALLGRSRDGAAQICGPMNFEWQDVDAERPGGFDRSLFSRSNYGRPLRILGGLIPVFAVVYAFALRSRGRGAIWRVWLPDRIQKDEGQAEPERLSWQGLESPRGSFSHLARAVGLSLLFSLVSAFQIGWRERRTWMTRLQPLKYMLRATGWVRVVSGIQSLLSVYLLALWALTYFGRPFE